MTPKVILRSPLRLALAATVMAMAVFVFVTDAPAYAGTASATCANCHVMDSMYENYYHAAHHAWAVCADCHLPHANAAIYYFEKGLQGMHDVFVFSTGQTPQVINISDHSARIVQQNCVRCHEATVESIMAGEQPFERDCWACHRNVAHGPRGAALVPQQDSNLYTLEKGE
jgi:cytochrome c nitrite reductase small subunit